MKVRQWDIMMHYLLQEKKDKEKKLPDKKDKKEDKKDKKEDKKSTKKTPKSKAKLKVKIKKSKLDEQIDRIEKQLKEYGEDRSPDWEEEDLDMDFDDAIDYDDDDDEELDDFDEITEPDYDDEEEFDFGEIEEELADAILESLKASKKKLNKIVRNPAGSNKKFHVYVNCEGKIKKISFGDPGLSIKRDSPERRKSFRARHKCDKPEGKNRCSARFWSCKQWRSGSKVEGE
jgi:hypothetical protein